MPFPTHIAIIPDGNRRWAKARGLPSFAGHRAGAKTAEKIFDAAYEAGIPYLTFWGASISNLTKRDPKEVAFLGALFERYFKRLARSKVVKERQIRVRVLGFWQKYLPQSLTGVVAELENTTQSYTKRNLTFLLGYNGTAEMVQAVEGIAAEKAPGPIDETTIKNHLFTKDLPPVDLVIRTGNDPHLSTGFMMWETAEAELYFSPKMWPEFTPRDLAAALAGFNSRERRFGG